ncbi:hypothetical protein IAT38_006163 [Cryptococcus sp. DSM 104549]
MSPYTRYTSNTAPSSSSTPPTRGARATHLFPCPSRRPSTRRGDRLAADLQQLVDEVESLSISTKSSPTMATSPSSASTDPIESMRAALWESYDRTSHITSALPHSSEGVAPTLSQMLASAEARKAIHQTSFPIPSTRPTSLASLAAASTPSPLPPPPDLPDEEGHYSPIFDYSDPSTPRYRTSWSKEARQRRQAASGPYARGRSGRRHLVPYFDVYEHSSGTSDAELSESSRGESPGPQTPSWSESELLPAGLSASDPFDMGNRYESVDLGATSSSLLDWMEQGEPNSGRFECGAKGGDEAPGVLFGVQATAPIFEDEEVGQTAFSFDDPWGMIAGQGTQVASFEGSAHLTAEYSGVQTYQEDAMLFEPQAPTVHSSYSYSALDQGAPTLNIHYADEGCCPAPFSIGSYTPLPSSTKRRTSRRLPSISDRERVMREERMTRARAGRRDGYDADEDEGAEKRPRKAAGRNGGGSRTVQAFGVLQVPQVPQVPEVAVEEPVERLIKQLKKTKFY